MKLHFPIVEAPCLELKECFDELNSYKELGHENWDGEGAGAISPLSVCSARTHIYAVYLAATCLGVGWREPSVGPSPGGEVMVEWEGSIKGYEAYATVHFEGGSLVDATVVLGVCDKSGGAVNYWKDPHLDYVPQGAAAEIAFRMLKGEGLERGFSSLRSSR